jgi:dTMP kinase
MEQTAFFQRVRDSYLERAAKEPDRFQVVNSDRPLEEIGPELELIMNGWLETFRNG